MVDQNSFKDPLSEISTSANTLKEYFYYDFEKLNDVVLLSEIGVVVFIAFFAHLLQNIIQRHFLNFLVREEEQPTFFQRLFYLIIAFLKPFIAFVLLILAMSITTIFTKKLEVYQLAIDFTLIWFLCILAKRAISSIFVRALIFCTLIPFLFFSALGLSGPVLSYLNSLGFNLAGIHLSVYLVIKTFLIATLLFSVARFISHSFATLIDSQNTIDFEIRDLIQNLFQIFLYTTITLITFDLVGIDLTSLAIIGGAIGIGIGIGLQKIAANFISGVIILVEQNVKVGHLIEINGGGTPGWIRHLGARAAVVDTGDGKELLIPNEELLTKTVIDWTSNGRHTRTDLRVKVSFKSDLEKAKSIMVEAVNSHPFCSKKNAPSCYLEKFTDNGAEFLLQFWVDDITIGKMDMQNDVHLYIWKRFAEEKIEHPAYPPILN